MKPPEFVLVGNIPDKYFAIDIADFLNQKTDIADLVSLKVFANSEFCPRFTVNRNDDSQLIGKSLEGKNVILISVHSDWLSRSDLSIRNMILARAAKDNGAERVILVEPDLFYSAQDRGPRLMHGQTRYKRSHADLYKFNGQAFSAQLYAQLLKTSGVDEVVTIHNHSYSCGYEYKKIFGPDNFTNLSPHSLYHHFLCFSGIVDPYNTILVAPDKGASEFTKLTAEHAEPFLPIILYEKTRTDESTVSLRFSDKSQLSSGQIRGKDVVILDDMVRTGSTLLDCYNMLYKHSPRNIICIITHFYSSEEVKRNLSKAHFDQIVTTNTLPTILNRDKQGRLRKRITVLKINKWIAHYLQHRLHLHRKSEEPFYIEDVSDKNPRSQFRNSFQYT